MAPPATGLAPATPPDAALRHIVGDCQDDFLKYRAMALASTRPLGIHQTRVALRRLRAAFGLFRSAVDGPVVRALAAEARWLAGECGAARDLQVFLTETAEDVPPAVRRVAGRLAQAHLERARSALASARCEDFRRQLDFFRSLPPADTAGRLDAFARTVLDKRHNKVLRRGRRLARLDSEQLHELRIAVKKLRYAAAFLQPAFASSRIRPYIEAATRLQNALGALNDRTVAAAVLADIAIAARPSEEIGGALKALGKQVGRGGKRRQRKLEQAWAQFTAVPCFWRAEPGPTPTTPATAGTRRKRT